MHRFVAIAALAGAVLTSTVATATEGFRPLPPISGTLRAGRQGFYGDRSLGSVPVRSAGPAVYDVRHGSIHGYGRGSDRVGFRHRGYGARLPLTARYGEPRLPVQADAGPPDYAGQGFAPETTAPGYGPTAYDQIGQPYGAGYGQGGGLGVYTAGAYGPGPRIIAIPNHYNVGDAGRGVVRSGCGCGSTGLFGALMDHATD